MPPRAVLRRFLVALADADFFFVLFAMIPPRDRR
jgi:hypothetical protein